MNHHLNGPGSAPRLAGQGPRLRVLAAALLFSTGGTAIKATQLAGWEVACLRSGVAFLALLVMLPAARRPGSWRGPLVGLGYAGALVSYAAANKLTTAASAVFLTSTAPLYVLFLAPWLLGERLRRKDLLFMVALALALGLFFVDLEPRFETAPDPFAGNLVGVVAGLFWALTVLGLRWLGRDEGRPGEAASAVVWGNLFAFAACLGPALPIATWVARDVWVIVYLGAVQIGLAYVLLIAGMRRVPALEASLLVLVEPVFNALLAWLVHGEVPGRWALAGGGLILVATAALITAGRARRGAARGRAAPRS